MYTAAALCECGLVRTPAIIMNAMCRVCFERDPEQGTWSKIHTNYFKGVGGGELGGECGVGGWGGGGGGLDVPQCKMTLVVAH